VRNLRAHAEVSVSIGTRADQESVRSRVQARARIVDPEAEPALATEVRALMDAKYGWSAGAIAEVAPLRSEVEP
jgi:hypothetical protein